GQRAHRRRQRGARVHDPPRAGARARPHAHPDGGATWRARSRCAARLVRDLTPRKRSRERGWTPRGASQRRTAATPPTRRPNRSATRKPGRPRTLRPRRPCRRPSAWRGTTLAFALAIVLVVAPFRFAVTKILRSSSPTHVEVSRWGA